MLYATACVLKDKYDFVVMFNKYLDQEEIGDDPLQKSSLMLDEGNPVSDPSGCIELFSTHLNETGVLPVNGSKMAIISKINAEQSTQKIEKNAVEMVMKIEDAEMQTELLTTSPDFGEKESFVSNEKNYERFEPQKSFGQGDGLGWLIDEKDDK